MKIKRRKKDVHIQRNTERLPYKNTNVYMNKFVQIYVEEITNNNHVAVPIVIIIFKAG